MSNRKNFDADFKQDAVNYYYPSGKTYEQVAADLKVSHSTLAKWVTVAKNNDGTVLHRGLEIMPPDADKIIVRLKKELCDSQDALDILKKL